MDPQQQDVQHEKSVIEKVDGVKEKETKDDLSVDLENSGAVKGDDSDGRVDWTFKQILATVSLCGLYVGSQLPLLFVGGTLTFIAADTGGASAQAWVPVSYSLALASVAPFCGSLQDILGRRSIALGGSVSICVGIIIVGTAHTLPQVIVGMVFAGAGAAVGELTALAGTSELVPVSKRGLYLALVTGFILPFTPTILYTQLLVRHASWRWGLWICLIYNGVSLAGVAIFYFPQAHLRHNSEPTRAVLKRIDYIGALLSIAGLTVFLVGLTAGGYQAPWSSAYVLSTLLIGVFLIVAFVVWEWKFAKFPMIPAKLFAGQRTVGMAFLVTFASGVYYYALINFVPILFEAVYNPDPIQVGLKGLGPGISVIAGAVFVNAALSVWKKNNREILLASAVLMTAFGAAVSVSNPGNPKTTVALSTIGTFGVGGVLVPAATIAITVCPDELIATTVAITLSIRVIGGSIGYAIYDNIFMTKLKNKLPTYIALYAVKAGLPLTSAKEFVELFVKAPQQLATARIRGLTPAVIQAATLGSRTAYADSLKDVWYTSIAFGLLSIICCIFLGNNSKFITNRIAANIRH